MNQENDCFQPLLPPDRLSLICPGLGQLVQRRYVSFFWHFTLLVLAIGSMFPFYLPLFLFIFGKELVVRFPETEFSFLGPLLYLSLTGLLLLLTPFLFTKSKRTLFRIYFVVLLAFSIISLLALAAHDIFVVFIIFILLLPILPLLLVVPLALLSRQDAASWKQGESTQPNIRLIFLTCLITLSSVYPGAFFPAVQAAREATRRMQCSSHLKGLTLAFHTYHEVYKSFPPAYTVDENGKPLHSWRVLILPFMEGQALYEKIRLDEPWDSEYNRQFHDARVSYYRCPSSFKNILAPLGRGTFQAGNCNYSVVIGEETIFPGSKATSLSDITDGTPNTILLVERIIPICWMDPNNEISFDIACEGVNRHLLGIGSEHNGGVNVGYADGSIRFLRHPTDGRTRTTYDDVVENIKPLLTKAAAD